MVELFTRPVYIELNGSLIGKHNYGEYKGNKLMASIAQIVSWC